MPPDNVLTLSRPIPAVFPTQTGANRAMVGKFPRIGRVWGSLAAVGLKKCCDTVPVSLNLLKIKLAKSNSKDFRDRECIS